MKISRVLTLKNLDTGENEEIKLDTKEIREFNFPKKAYIINKVFIDNLWLKIAVLVWVLVLSTLLVLAKISQNYGFLAILIFTSLITITLAVNFPIARRYFFGEEILNIKKTLTIRWMWVYIKEVESPKSPTEKEKKTKDFLEKAIKEINKIAIRFYFSNLVVALALLSLATILMVENQSDERVYIFIAGVWFFAEFYLWKIRYFIRDKARVNYDITARADNGVEGSLISSFILEAKFSLNGNYAIEEEVSFSKSIRDSIS